MSEVQQISDGLSKITEEHLMFWPLYFDYFGQLKTSLHKFLKTKVLYQPYASTHRPCKGALSAICRSLPCTINLSSIPCRNFSKIFMNNPQRRKVQHFVISLSIPWCLHFTPTEEKKKLTRLPLESFPKNCSLVRSLSLQSPIPSIRICTFDSCRPLFMLICWPFPSFQSSGKLLQSKGTKDATREAKLLFQRALDIRTAKQGVYHTDTKTIRRALMSLETVDLGAKFSSKGTGKDQELLALEGLRSRSLTKTSSRNLDFRQASAS